jgi:outer membrane protein
MTKAEAGSPEPVIKLEDAIKMATKVQPAVVQAGTALDIAHSGQRQAVGAWLPTVTAGTNVTRSSLTRFNTNTGQVVTTQFPYSGSANVTANLMVFDFGKRLFANRQANAITTSAEAQLVNQKFQIALQTKQAFFNALAAVDLERVALTAVERAQEQLKVSREKLLAGSAIRSDTLQSTVTLGQAKLQLLTAQAARATQEAALAHLIGFDKPVRPVGDSSQIAIVGIDTAAVRAEAVRTSPAIAAADAQLRAADATVNANRTVYLPTINATYVYQRSGSAVGLFSSDTAGRPGALNYPSLNPTWNFSVALTWPLFNGFQREYNLDQAVATRDYQAAFAADQRRSVDAQITQFVAGLESALTSFQIAEASREAADEALRIQRERYRLGAATIVDVLNAQVSLNQAESDAVNARVNYQVAKAQLEALVGHSL